ncbi:MAG: hypothetical protein JW797_10390 [Bradymonadales bacterium]|nr:hypothetical protein [Bradymonadales bacterium]
MNSGRSGKILSALSGLMLACLVHCGDMAEWDESGAVPEGEDRTQDAGYQDTAGSDVAPWQDASEPFIPEEEEYKMQAPVASRSYVFVANTSLNAVAKIDSQTLQITTIDVGMEPTIVCTSPAGDTVVVLNQGSHDLSIIRADQGDEVTFVDIQRGSNSLLMSPDGSYVLAYYNPAIAEPGDVAGSLSDASLVRLDQEPLVAYNLVVGFHIREVEFSASGEIAYFITDDGVAVVQPQQINQDRFIPPIHLSLDLVNDPLAIDREVEITGNGAFALVRSSQAPTLRLVDLTTHQIAELELAGIPTDLDLLPSGEEIVAVLRDAGEILVIPVPSGFEDPVAIGRIDLGEEVVGLVQLIPGTRLVVGYSTVGENDHLSLIDLDSGDIETFALRKGIQAVHVSPGSSRLLVIHTKLPGEAIPGTESFVAQSYAFSVFNLQFQVARMVFVDAPPGAFTYSADGQMVFMLVADEALGVRSVQWTNLATGRDMTIPLRRMPESIGLIPATGLIYVSEEHEVGRMAFIDPQSGKVKEVTGYHLNSRTE